MGEFTQNLLKLTEFPFSYSLLGLLALIFGHGINPEELSFAKIGPLLILMGFVATTLSICDPAGAIQRAIIKGRRKKLPWKRFDTSFHIFGSPIHKHFPLAYIFAITYLPENIKKKGSPIDWDVVRRVFEYEKEQRSWGFEPLKRSQQHQIPIKRSTIFSEENPDYGPIFGEFSKEFRKIGLDDIRGLAHWLEGLKQQTVRTKWITAEVDRINALVYFIIVISVFIVALHSSDFLQKFARSFSE
jgi:hypothetical protein